MGTKLTAAQRRTLEAAGVKLPVSAAKRSKYGAVPTMVDGCRFASKAEAAYYSHLRLRYTSGIIKWFIRQVPFHLTPHSKYVADFLYVDEIDRIHVIDIKGKDTETSRLKRRQVKDIYGITVQVVKATYRGKTITGWEEIE